jgi:uncharacterized membrane protein
VSDKPVTIAVATYCDRDGAEQDFDAVWGIKHEGQLDHVAVALVTKHEDGKLHVDRHNTSAKHLAWGGGILGAAATVISAPLGIVFLGPLAASTAVWAGVGGLVGHFWENVPKDELARMSDVLEAGEYGLVIVAVNPKGVDVGALLANARSKSVSDGQVDTEGAIDRAFEEVSD